MKKILIVAATAGLMSLAACNSGTTNTTAENVAEGQEANTEMYQEAADNTSNATEEAILDNAAEAADNAHDQAEANVH